MTERPSGSGGRRRRLLNTSIRPPKATHTTLSPALDHYPHADEQTTEATSLPVLIPPAQHEEQSTDLTGRPGTPSAVRRRVAARNKGPRSLLGPEAYHVGDGIRPQTTDVTLLMDPADRPTDHGDPDEILARVAGLRGVQLPPRVPSTAMPPVLAASPAPAPQAAIAIAQTEASVPTSGAALAAAAFDLENWDEPENTPPGAPPRTKTDPFGLNLHTDEVDMLARAGATFPEAFERSFFERETQPIPRSSFVPPSNFVAALAVVAFGLVAVIALTVSAWIALSTPQPTVSSAAEREHTLPQVPAGAPAPSHGGANAPPPPPPEHETPSDPGAHPPDQSVADLPT